jgi:acetyl-CoA/propionyl-CoA carboxylase biotin carboxyl carrier protein
VSGIDLVQEMFRIADGEPIGYLDPAPRGHSIEFRVNGEDPGRNFLPTPGTVTRFAPPSGPGVRLDSGVEPGSVIGAAWDSLLAKLVITGANRRQALRRAARALAEFAVEGIPTTLPFHRAVVTDPAFAAPDAESFTIHTRWIETEFAHRLAPSTAPVAEMSDGFGVREAMVVEVGGRRLEVALLSTAPAAVRGNGGRSRRRALDVSADGAELTAPMLGTVVRVAVQEGQRVSAGDLVVVLEAMKMEQPVCAHHAGVIADLRAAVGDSVSGGAVLCRITEATSPN